MSDVHAEFTAIVDKANPSAFFDVVDSVHHEVKIDVTDRGFHASAIGPANVAGFDATLDAEGFDSLSVDRPGSMAMKVEKMADVIPKVNEDLIKLEYGDDHMLSIDGGPIGYDASTLDLSGVPSSEFDIDYDDHDSVTIGQTAEKLSGAVSTAGLVGDEVRFCYDSERGAFIVGARGDTEQAQVEFTDSDGEGGYLSATESLLGDSATFSSVYEIKYLKNLLAPMDNDTAVTVTFAEEMPMIWNYSIGEHVRAQTLMAPRMPPE